MNEQVTSPSNTLKVTYTLYRGWQQSLETSWYVQHVLTVALFISRIRYDPCVINAGSGDQQMGRGSEIRIWDTGMVILLEYLGLPLLRIVERAIRYVKEGARDRKSVG